MENGLLAPCATAGSLYRFAMAARRKLKDRECDYSSPDHLRALMQGSQIAREAKAHHPLTPGAAASLSVQWSRGSRCCWGALSLDRNGAPGTIRTSDPQIRSQIFDCFKLRQ